MRAKKKKKTKKKSPFAKKKGPREVWTPAPSLGDMDDEPDPDEILELGYTRMRRAEYQWLMGKKVRR